MILYDYNENSELVVVLQKKEEEGGRTTSSSTGYSRGLRSLLSSIIVITTTMTTTKATAQSADRIYESEEDGFRLQIPQSWVIQDNDIISDPNVETVAILCLENEALPAIGGGHNCEDADITDMVWIDRWSDLQSRPEFENITSSNITTNDLLALRIQYLTNNASVSQIKIENSTDLDQFTKLVNMTYKCNNR